MIYFMTNTEVESCDKFLVSEMKLVDDHLLESEINSEEIQLLESPLECKK